jgi:ribosome-binding protein aMBF1 (putative translation factor)
MKCQVCGKKTNRAVRVTAGGSMVRFNCCKECRDLVLEEVKRKYKRVIVNPKVP